MGVRVLYFRQCLPLSMDGKGASPGDELAANGRSIATTGNNRSIEKSFINGKRNAEKNGTIR